MYYKTITPISSFLSFHSESIRWNSSFCGFLLITIRYTISINSLIGLNVFQERQAPAGWRHNPPHLRKHRNQGVERHVENKICKSHVWRNRRESGKRVERNNILRGYDRNFSSLEGPQAAHFLLLPDVCWGMANHCEVCRSVWEIVAGPRFRGQAREHL
jgi:hypothetical protein